MRVTSFPCGSGSLQVSELGFGCAAVAGRVSRSDSLRALHAAFDMGVTFYDTARSYGYGQSEAIVGEFAAGRRDRVVLCTKFGILPAAAGGWKQKVKPLAQKLVQAFPSLRAMAQKQVKDQFVGNQFTAETFSTSLETSLRELKSEYVDLLLLHAAPESVLEQEDLLAALARVVESGKVRMAGISADLPVIERYFEQRPAPLASAQFALNLQNLAFAEHTRCNADLLLVGNHVFGGPAGAKAGKAMLAALHTASDLPLELREKLDPGDPQTFPEMVLNCVLRGTGLTSIVPAMMQVPHIESNVQALERCRFSAPELDLLRSRLAQTSVARQDDRPAAAQAPSA